MSLIEMYKPEYDVSDIFKALKKVNNNELLPENSVFDFFYQNSQYPGLALFLKYKSRIKFFYIDHDDFILEIKDQIPEWEISIDKNIVRISLVYKVNGTTAPVIFVFDIADKSYRDLLQVVGKNKEIKLYYLSMLYGGLVFDSMIKFKAPSDVIKVLKKIK